VQAGLGRRVEQEAVPVGARLVSSVGRDDEERRERVLQLLAHLSDRLAVAAAAVVHGLAWEEENVGVNAGGGGVAYVGGGGAYVTGGVNTPTNLTFHTRCGSRRLSGLKELILEHI